VIETQQKLCAHTRQYDFSGAASLAKDRMDDDSSLQLHYITLETIYSGLSTSNFKDHYGDAVTEECLGMIAEITKCCE